MCTFTGKRFYPLDPKVEDISIMDIAHGLSNVCRYGGQCKVFYSVAQHSVLVSQSVHPDNARWGLLHDASEAYIGDIIAPLKTTVQYDSYREVETVLMRAICKRFGLPEEMPDEVHDADMVVRYAEMRDFGSAPEEYWINEPKITQIIEPVSPTEARILFLREFERLYGYDWYTYA
jgi:hypothetical protein